MINRTMCRVFLMMVFILASVSVMAMDQRSVLVIEFNNGRNSLSIPTDQIRHMSFQSAPEGAAAPPTVPPAGGAASPDSKTFHGGRVWNQVEGAWKGTWTRRGNSNVYDAVWTRDNLRATAVLTIEIEGNKVVVKRRQSSDGDNFDYNGILSPGGNTVSGTYSVKGSLHDWSASILP